MKIFRKIVLGLMVLVVIVVGLWAYRTHEAVARVESYKPQVQAELAKSGLQGDTQLVLAIIYTETKGGSADIMQSSESLYGKGGANAIASQTESISQGVDELTSLIEYSNSKGCDVYTAVQAYNFGKAYIDYVAVHGKVTSVKLADAYSRTVVAPSLGNKTGATYRHLTWDSLFYNGGKLYVNGGNFFYAGEVHFNFDLLKIFG